MIQELNEWLSFEPERRRCEISYLGKPEDYSGPLTHEPCWLVTLWSQRPDGTKYKEPGIGSGSTLNWALSRAFLAYEASPRINKESQCSQSSSTLE